MKINLQGKIIEAKDGTRLQQLAAVCENRKDSPIVLAEVDGVVMELYHKLHKDCSIRWITLKDPEGFAAAQRSVIFMMIKAFYSTAGKDNVHTLTAEFALGDGLFFQAEGNFTLSQPLLNKVKEKMLEYQKKQFPIRKHSVHREDAMDLFTEYHMDSKVRLISYRRTGHINLYALGYFEDYFYGEMVPDAGCIPVFDLQLYEDGFLLRLPEKNIEEGQECLQPKARAKLFTTLKESRQWQKKISAADVGNLNDQISSGRSQSLVLVQEALQEKKIAEIAAMIQANPSKKLIMIAGPSSSGKTTFSHRLSTQLSAAGLHPHPIEVDSYFVNREFSPRHPDGSYDFEALECLDIKQFNADMRALLAGEKVELPSYNFKTGQREYRGNTLQLKEDDILVIEGIHCLNDALSYSLPKESKFKIYISALSSLNIDEHNYVPARDIRLLRRILRDARVRGVNAQDTIAMWPSVKAGEEKNIFPFQEDADVMFNSASIYELAVLKPYVEPLLFQIDPKSDEGREAKRLLKFLDYFLCIPSEYVPDQSLIREFIGGGCFHL